MRKNSLFSHSKSVLESQLPLDILMITKYYVTKQGDCSHFSLQESHQGVIQNARKLARKLGRVDSVTRPLRILCQSTLCVQGKMGQSCPLNSGRTQKLAHLFLRWNFRVLPNLSEVPTFLGGKEVSPTIFRNPTKKTFDENILTLPRLKLFHVFSFPSP